MSRRRVRPDELELWRKVTAQTEPLQQKITRDNAPEQSEQKARPEPKPKPLFEDLPMRPNASSTRLPVSDLAPSLRDGFDAAPLRMDRRAFDQMKRGKIKPEGRLDLHGMTLDRAHPALIRFILGAQTQGKRLVLVITGKGKSRDEGGPIPVRLGVLRHQVPQWLSLPPLSSVVLQVTPAHLRHGGDGAYYVYLKRVR